MNCLVLETEKDLVLIDCGIQFPDASYTGVDLLVPDLDYVRDRLDKLRGVVVTHGHDDHIGAIPFLLKETDVDVYCTPFPRGLIENKLTEYHDIHEVKFHKIVPRKRFKVGAFHFDPIPVQHSIIESLAFGIETPAGNIVHTGDFKHDPNEVSGQKIGLEAFEEWAEKGVMLLMSDSTNAERVGHTISENDITATFEKIFRNQASRLIIALFASNIKRIENFLHLAHKAGKKVAFAGRSMHSYTRLAHEQGSLNIPEDTVVLLESLERYPPQDVIILATGSQAEPGSALVRIAHGKHREVHIRSGDVVIMSSRFIPGNERNITGMIDQLYRAGADVMYEAVHQIHVSGHGFQDELVLMLKAVKPKFFVPIHGEYRHLKKHALLAQRVGISPSNILVIEDGQSLEADKKGIRLGEKRNLRKTAIIEHDLLVSDAETLSQRQALSKTGVVFCALLRDAKTRRLIDHPSLTYYGLLFRKGEDPEEVRQGAIDRLEEINDEYAKSPTLADHIRLEIRRYFKKRVSHKPLVVPFILDV